MTTTPTAAKPAAKKAAAKPAAAAAAAKPAAAKPAATKPAAAKPAAARPATKRASSKNQGHVLPEDHTASEAVAHAITSLHADLATSVNRIMAADLDEDARFVAISLFRHSLNVPGDQYRYPVNAIEGGRQMVAIPSAD